MDEFFAKKRNACAIILVSILAFSALNISRAYKPLLEAATEEASILSAAVPAMDAYAIDSSARRIENEINDNIMWKYVFLDIYGYLQLIMGKNEQSNFETAKDKMGFLHETGFSDGAKNVYALSERMLSLKEAVGDDIELLYVLTPDKYAKGQTAFSYGMPYDYANETADLFLNSLDENKINYMDMREKIADAGMSYTDVFYKSDEHWKIESAFMAFTVLADYIGQSIAEDISKDGFYTSIENYNSVTYPHSYVGSYGRKTGRFYSGIDDFTIIFPKFKTDFSLVCGDGESFEHEFSGLFEDIFISALTLRSRGDPYSAEADKYYSFFNNYYGVCHVKNRLEGTGPKIAFISDTMMNPVIGFMTTVCSEVYAINADAFNGDIAEFIKECGIDFVVVSYSPKNLENIPEF